MDERKIQLPDFIIADLYKESLVEIGHFPLHEETVQPGKALTKTEETVEPVSISFLGENKKKVSIIVNDAQSVHVKEADLSFLTNILKACNLTLSDIAIINQAVQTVDYESLKQQLTPEKILLFDVDPSTIKLPFLVPPFQIQKFDNVTIMVAPPLHLLNQTAQDARLLKSKLWLSLKQVFNIP
jgi:hypothetical protein